MSLSRMKLCEINIFFHGLKLLRSDPFCRPPRAESFQERPDRIYIMDVILFGFSSTAVAVYGAYFKLQSFVASYR